MSLSLTSPQLFRNMFFKFPSMWLCIFVFVLFCFSYCHKKENQVPAKLQYGLRMWSVWHKPSQHVEKCMLPECSVQLPGGNAGAHISSSLQSCSLGYENILSSHCHFVCLIYPLLGNTSQYSLLLDTSVSSWALLIWAVLFILKPGFQVCLFF